jgi:LysM repeat protein
MPLLIPTKKCIPKQKRRSYLGHFERTDGRVTPTVTRNDVDPNIDLDLEIDNRYVKDFSGALKDDLKVMADTVYTKEAGLGGNTKRMTERLIDVTTDLVDATVKGGGNIVKTFDKYDDKIARREALSQMSKEELSVVANPEDYTSTEKKAVADKYSQAYSEVRGIDSAEANIFDDATLDPRKAIDNKGLDKRDMVGFTDSNPNNDQIFYEVDKINEGDNFVTVLGHENKRQDQIEKGIVNNTPDGVSTQYDKEAKEAGQHNLAALQREMKYKNVEYNRSVSSGDTLYSITRDINQQNGTTLTVNDVAKMNNISDPTKIKLGQKIVVKNDMVRSERDKQLVADGSRSADNVEDIQPSRRPMNLEAFVRQAYTIDTERNLDEDWENVQVNMSDGIDKGVENVKKGIEKVGDINQAIPDYVLSGTGLVAGGVAVLGTGGVIPLAAGIGYLATGLGTTKSFLDYSEGEKTRTSVIIDSSLDAASTFIPYVGPLIDGGQFMYDTIKYNYENRTRVPVEAQKKTTK